MTHRSSSKTSRDSRWSAASPEVAWFRKKTSLKSPHELIGHLCCRMGNNLKGGEGLAPAV